MIASISPPSVLIVEDEPAIVDVLVAYLRDEGFATHRAADGESGLREAIARRPDLILLDLNLPNLHGREVFRRIREVYDAPIILLTTRSSEIDIVVGLELGADDYIAKPFSPREVVARVKSVLRRSRRAAETPVRHDANVPQRVGSIEIDRTSHEVRRHTALVNVTPTEFRILDVLSRHLGQVLTRGQLLDRISTDDAMYDRTLDRHVGNLRQKVEDDPRHPAYIFTIFGVGYKMVDAHANARP